MADSWDDVLQREQDIIAQDLDIVSRWTEESLIGRAQLMGSRGRARYFGRDEPEDADYDWFIYTDDPEETAKLKRKMEFDLTLDWDITERADGSMTASRGNIDITVAPKWKFDLTRRAWMLIELCGLDKHQAWAIING